MEKPIDTRKLNKMTLCGGCAAKLPPGLLKDAINTIPRFEDENLLVGFDTSDDGAVYKLTDDLAIICTLDFFPPMVDDPYLFGQIAATNALSDIYAMGGEVKTALNIVCFPQGDDPAMLAQILKGGAKKVLEAGGVLCGGHSIDDRGIKYGLSVVGTVHPDKIKYNNKCNLGDVIILTKPLGVGIITSAYKAGKASEASFTEAVSYMTRLNKYAASKLKNPRVSSCTDVTGFGFLGHLNEMVTDGYSIRVKSKNVPFIAEAKRLAFEGYITGGGVKNRQFLSDKVSIGSISTEMEEILFDPQTSGGLLISVNPLDSHILLKELEAAKSPGAIVGEVVEREDKNIIVV